MASLETAGQYVAAAFWEISSKYDNGINLPIGDVYELIEKEFKIVIEPEVVDDALSILRKCGMAFIANDPLAGKFVRITKESCAGFFSRLADEQGRYEKIVSSASDEHEGINVAESREWPVMTLAGQYPVLSRYNQFGSRWIAIALSQMSLDGNQLNRADASDRVVNFSDNQPLVDEIDDGLEEIERAISENNEVGDALAGNQDIALEEVRNLRAMLKGARARKEVLLSYSKQVLGWIAKEVSKTSLSEIVKHVMKLFVGWLS